MSEKNVKVINDLNNRTTVVSEVPLDRHAHNKDHRLIQDYKFSEDTLHNKLIF